MSFERGAAIKRSKRMNHRGGGKGDLKGEKFEE